MTGGSRRTVRHVALLLAVVAATALTGLVVDRTGPEGRSATTPSTTLPSRSPSATPAVALPVAPTGPALSAVGRLLVSGRAPLTGYTRAAFGQEWLDTDRNGCDTRNDVLRRDLTGVVVRPGTHGCLVLSGSLLDPYSGTTVPFTRGASTSRSVQVDHVVALADAWQEGAQPWTPQRRAAFANDPLELLAVGGSVNEAKGAGDAATWLPPATAYRCPYAARQVAVKLAWGLRVTVAERDALRRVLATCPGQPLPTRQPFVLG